MVCFDCAYQKPFFDRVPCSGFFSQGDRIDIRDTVTKTLSDAIPSSH